MVDRGARSCVIDWCRWREDGALTGSSARVRDAKSGETWSLPAVIESQADVVDVTGAERLLRRLFSVRVGGGVHRGGGGVGIRCASLMARRRARRRRRGRIASEPRRRNARRR